MDLTNIVKEVATRCLSKYQNNKPKVKHRKSLFWNKECDKHKKQFKKSKRKLHHDPTDNINRNNFFIDKKNYRKCLRNAKLNWIENQVNKISEVEKSDPKLFWKTIRDLSEKNTVEENLISPKAWVQHFKNIFNSNTPQNNFSTYIKSVLTTIENSAINTFNTSLDKFITEDEISSIIDTSSNGKTPGIDSVSIEMIKCGKTVLLKPICKLFNLIFDSGSYPKCWNTDYIIPIHKSGTIHDPTNYRPVVISNTFYKIFSKILCNRLVSYFNEKNLWKPNQCGFKKGHRTEDNVFILQSLYDHYVTNKSNKLYLAFIDFRKFFDTINRKALLYKLLKYGVTGKTYNIIKSMYEDTNYHIRCNKGLTPAFRSLCGVKQGCCTSPILSNIFQNDLHDIFNLQCDPVEIGHINLNSLSFADDLILVSKTPSGLQNCLNSLYDYCEKWGLLINHDKSKVMVMSKGTITRNIPIFKFDKNILDVVQTYKYLGVMIYSNGKFSNAMYDRLSKAKRALFLVKRALYTTGCISVRVALSVFDKQILPILSYGSVIWSLPKRDIVNIDRLEYEKFHHSFCKNILGVSKKASNANCLGELGRFPISHTLWNNCLKFWLRMSHGCENKLLNALFTNDISDNSWCQKLKKLLYKNGLGNMWNNPENYNMKQASNIFITRLNDQYKQTWFDKQKGMAFGNKLLDLKDTYQYSRYLDIIKNIEIRKIFVKLRTGFNTLNSSLGRFKNKNGGNADTEKDCKNCNVLESVEHFLFECKNFTDIRIKYIHKIDKLCKGFINWNVNKKCISLLNFTFPENKERNDLEKTVCSFIKEMYSKRLSV